MELTQQRVRELFDYKDGELLWRQGGNGVAAGSPAGSVRSPGYKSFRKSGRYYFVHRIVFLWHHGYLPNYVDHQDGIKTNNQIENLRDATHSQNLCNRGKTSSNKSGFKGVSWSTKEKKWIARITTNRKVHCLGSFVDLESAATAYEVAAKRLHGEFARF